MIKKGQWGKWFLVFFLMSFFTLVQAPISQYALGIGEQNTRDRIENVNNQTVQENMQETEKESIEESIEENIEENIEKSIEENIKDNIEENKDENPEADTKIKKKPVYLTIDDGPGIFSKQILDILASNKIQATFFVLEPRVRYYSDMIRRMDIEGHELGVHGVTHNVKRFYASPESVVNEMTRTRYSLRTLTGKEHYLARTPYGSFPYLNKEQERSLINEGYKIWDWNVDSRDWYFRNERYVQYTISQLERLQQNGTIPVILIHELETTARYLPLLIDYLLSNDYEFKTLNLEDKPVRLR